MVEHQVAQDFRSIILYGRNVASYKFALGGALLELASQGRTSVDLADLAVPYARRLVEHVQRVETQTTARGSRFLATCLHFSNGLVNHDELVAATVVLGFKNVIDAFPVVDGRDNLTAFYVDRRPSGGGLEFTDELMELSTSVVVDDLEGEVEARWSLVERAWESRKVDGQPLVLSYDSMNERLRPALLGKRRSWTQDVRPALNGYQRGHCFYCYRRISVLGSGDNASHVDHLLPHVAINRGVFEDLDHIWNLVLACTSCNLSKGDALPSTRQLAELHRRNEWLITSHHPLREAVIEATGPSSTHRRAFLQRVHRTVGEVARSGWSVPPAGPNPFGSLDGLTIAG